MNFFAAIGGGVVLAPMQRIREIAKGEIDDANDIKKSKRRRPSSAPKRITFLGIFWQTILFPLIGEAMGEAPAVGFLLDLRRW